MLPGQPQPKGGMVERVALGLDLPEFKSCDFTNSCFHFCICKVGVLLLFGVALRIQWVCGQMPVPFLLFP